MELETNMRLRQSHVPRIRSVGKAMRAVVLAARDLF